MQKRDGQGETEANTKGGTEEAKGGEEMTREEVVQAALTVERWCMEQINDKGECKCPFADGAGCVLDFAPIAWNLEEFLRTRGLKHD